MKICNCQYRCFEYVNRFGFLKSDLPGTLVPARGTKSESYIDGGTEILLYSLYHSRSVFSYEPKTEYINYVIDPDRTLNAQSLKLCEEAISRLINICLLANQNLEIGYNVISKEYESYSLEEFMQVMRDKKLEALMS